MAQHSDYHLATNMSHVHFFFLKQTVQHTPHRLNITFSPNHATNHTQRSPHSNVHCCTTLSLSRASYHSRTILYIKFRLSNRRYLCLPYDLLQTIPHIQIHHCILIILNPQVILLKTRLRKHRH